MPNYLSIDGIQTSGYLPYILGDLASGTFPGTVITDKICDIDFASMEIQYDISLNEIHYTVSPVEYAVDGNRYYVLGNARFAFGPDIAVDTGEQFAIVVDADAYDNQASTISRILYVGLPETDDNAEPIDAIDLELKETEDSEEGEESESPAEVTRRAFPNTYIFEVDGATSLDTTIAKSYGSEMIVHINPVQTGSGTPSPSNVRPIDGWTGAILTGDNVNEQSSYSIDWAGSVGTVYGGTLNVNTGLMIITHACIDSYDGESLPGEWISSMDSYSSGATPTTGSQVVYELASPTRQYIYISDENQYLELQNPTSNTGVVDVTDYPDEIYTIGTSASENPLIRRRALKITGTTGAVIIGNGTLLSLSDYPSYTPVDTGDDFAVLIPNVYATANNEGEIPATVVISSSFASAMTSEFAIQVIHYGLDRFRTFSVDDYTGSESAETGSLYRILNEYGQAGPIPDIDDSKYDEALHGQNIVANSILAAQIDVQNLMAQNLSMTGKIHSSNKTSATDNNEGFFLGYEPVNGVNRATFGVGASDNAHITYTGTSLDIKTNWLKFDENTESVTIGKTVNADNYNIVIGSSASSDSSSFITLRKQDTDLLTLSSSQLIMRDTAAGSYNPSGYFTVVSGRDNVIYNKTQVEVASNESYSTSTRTYTLSDWYDLADTNRFYFTYGLKNSSYSYITSVTCNFVNGTPSTFTNYGITCEYDGSDTITMSSSDSNATYGGMIYYTYDIPRTAPGYIMGRLLDQYGLGDYSVSTGYNNEVVGQYAFGSGYQNQVYGQSDHVEGTNNFSNGGNCHVEGTHNEATASACHAEGAYVKASAPYSHASGYGTRASSNYQTVMGRHNTEDTNNAYALIIGNGTSDSARSNALTVDWNGCVDAGQFISRSQSVTIGTTPSSNYYLNGFTFRDKNNIGVGSFQLTYLNNGQAGVTMESQRTVNGTTSYNSLRLLQDANGNAVVNLNASAWRTALQLNNILDLFRVVSFKKTNVSINANGTATAAITITIPSGFTAVCIVNTRCDATDTTSSVNMSNCFVYNSWISGTTANVSIKNIASSAAKVTAWAYVLFERNTL